MENITSPAVMITYIGTCRKMETLFGSSISTPVTLYCSPSSTSELALPLFSLTTIMYTAPALNSMFSSPFCSTIAASQTQYYLHTVSSWSCYDRLLCTYPNLPVFIRLSIRFRQSKILWGIDIDDILISAKNSEILQAKSWVQIHSHDWIINCWIFRRGGQNSIEGESILGISWGYMYM